jgi:hypothetical protein
VQVLSREDVQSIYNALVTHFAEMGEPIEPAGVRSLPLLDSAVSGQSVGFGTIMKYAELRDNAATLLYGIRRAKHFLGTARSCHRVRRVLVLRNSRSSNNFSIRSNE